MLNTLFNNIYLYFFNLILAEGIKYQWGQINESEIFVDNVVTEPETLSKTKSVKRTLGSILKNADAVFDAFNGHIEKLGSNVSSNTKKAIRHHGVYIPNEDKKLSLFEDNLVDSMQSLVDVDIKARPGNYASFMCVGFHAEDYTNAIKRDIAQEKLIYLIRLDKLPWEASKQNGIPYEIGVAMEVGVKHPKNAWVCGYCTIEADGTIHICKILHEQEVYVKNQGSSYMKKSREVPFYFSNKQKNKADGRVLAFKHFIKRVIEIWDERADTWDVSIMKGKLRLCFGVPWRDTKYFFDDREKLVSSIHGQTKRIIHYVACFKRLNGQNVKEHVRGLSEFDWQGYSVVVTAPKFGAAAFYKHDLVGTSFEKDEPKPGDWMDSHVAEAKLKKIDLKFPDKRYRNKNWLKKKESEILLRRSDG